MSMFIWKFITHTCRLIYGFVFSYNSGIIYSQDVQPIDRFVVEEYLLDVLLYLNGWYVFFFKTLGYLCPCHILLA